MTSNDRALLVTVLAEVRAIRELLERRRDGRDPAADGRLVLALAAAAGSKVFAAPDVLRHAAVDLTLGAALEAAGVHTTRQVGQALRRCRDRDFNGFTLERIGRDDRGALWSVAAVSDVQHTGA